MNVLYINRNTNIGIKPYSKSLIELWGLTPETALIKRNITYAYDDVTEYCVVNIETRTNQYINMDKFLNMIPSRRKSYLCDSYNFSLEDGIIAVAIFLRGSDIGVIFLEEDTKLYKKLSKKCKKCNLKELHDEYYPEDKIKLVS